MSVSVTPQQKSVLLEIGKRREVSLARVIQEAIKEFIERYPERRLPLFEKPLLPRE